MTRAAPLHMVAAKIGRGCGLAERTKPGAGPCARWLIFRHENFGHLGFTVAVSFRLLRGGDA
jgi:hypothetical protein